MVNSEVSDFRGKREVELSEFQAVATSRLFSGDTNPARFLRFVGERYFGGVNHVSEKELAVGVFGRNQDFDSLQDSIVRVEAHRVRRRLSEYYNAEGANHPIRLRIPQGTYMPDFVPVPEAEEKLVKCVQENAETEFSNGGTSRVSDRILVNKSESGRQSPRLRGLLILLLTVAVAAVVTGIFLYRDGRNKATSRTGSSAVSPATLAPSNEVLIMAGSSANAYSDQLGHVWSADRYFKGGDPWKVSYRQISRTDDPQLYLTSRQGSDFEYEIPLPRGLYELRLYFAETFYGEGNREGGGESSRIFDVLANGAPILTQFDPLSDAGGSNTADVRVFSGMSPAADGKLHLEFRTRWDLKSIAFVNAIQIIRTGRQSMLPIRWVAANSAIEDTNSNLWLPDQFVQGGRRRELAEVVTNTNDPELYKSERYGNFNYAIPVSVDNTYSLTLHFSEHWWGVPNYGGPSSSAGGMRLFDVYCNGVYLLQNYDIFKQAGGSLRAVSVTFHGIKPNHQGKIQLSFVPARHYASIDAIEVDPERTN